LFSHPEKVFKIIFYYVWDKKILDAINLFLCFFRNTNYDRKTRDNSCNDSDTYKMPCNMCREMITGIMVTANTVKLVTTELKGLFDEWCPQIEKEMLDFIKEKGTIEIDGLAEKFSLSEGNIKYLLSRLAVKNLIDCKA
jgi:hypothetical protein